MATTNVSSVYLHVIDSVVNKLREEFVSEGVDDAVLAELQGLWELKMMQCGVVQGPIERNSTVKGAGVPTPVHDLNVPYEGTEEYETPTAEMLFPPTPLQTPIQTPLPAEPTSYQYLPASHSEYGLVPNSGAATDTKPGRPAPYMQQPSPWMGQRPLGVDVNVAYEEGREEDGGGGIAQTEPPVKDFFMLNSGKRKRDDYPSNPLPNEYIPQQDGSADALLESSLQEVPVANICPKEAHVETLRDRLKLQETKNIDAAIASMVRMKQTAITIPQHDGYDDNVYDNGVRTEDYNTPYDPATANGVGTPIPGRSEAVEDDEPPLNEDDDDDLDDLEQGDEEPSTSHLVLAQFEKVSRTKSRWKCILKDGIMHLNNKDILFSKANGEFEF
ncbi:hypothetical protein AQUCO_03400399v1 [Aquilegia coerulea]|uniref:Uncharacterized protein n=1 Tax=Aquilegia coerulea TaxID=218851 RepID=A0A2G5CZV9_AQUCA|nr:hypothetical protein AQUCO_03400399v1 [Aquilegia coerulea]